MLVKLQNKMNIKLMFILMALTNCYAQNVNMFTGTVSRCGNVFYDSGGNGSNYSNNEDYTLTIQPTTACSNVRLSFTSFNVEGGREYLSIYNGDNIGAPLIGTYTGTTSPGTVTATNGALTIRFTSNAVFTRLGWVANISCVVSPPMSFSSHTAADLAAGGTVLLCDKEVQMMRIDVNVAGSCLPALDMTNITINLSGTALLTSIDKVRVFYTGNSNVFSNAVEFGTIGGTNPLASTLIVGSQSLLSGTNYFWVTLDLSGSGIAGQTISTQLPLLNAITVAGVSYNPIARPLCTKTYSDCNAFAGIGIRAWYRPENMSVVSGKVSSWTNDPLGTAGAFTISQGTAANRPNHIQGSVDYKKFNYHDRADFVAASNTYLYNTNTTPDLMGTTGAIFLIFDQQDIDGTGFTYSSNLSTNRYQLKPQWRFQTGTGTRGTTYDWFGVAPSDAPREAGHLIASTGINSNMIIRRNSILDNTPNNLNSATYNPAITAGLYFGKNSTGGEPVSNDLAEAILLNVIPTTNQINAIESYLSLKYGLTRGDNAGTSSIYNYISSSLTTIWDKTINTGFNNDIAGIGRDDNSTLNQKQSISVNNNEPVTIGLSTIAAENDLNATLFTSNNSFLVWGNNGMSNQTVASNPDCFDNLPASIQAKIERTWKCQVTNFSQQVTIGFETSMLVAYTPLSNLRLLVSNSDSDWSSSAIYSGAVLNGSRIEFSGITIDGANPFFTLGTIDYASTPLPVELVNFEAIKNNTDIKSVDIKWETESETNSSYFEVEKSSNGIEWASISIVEAAGNSITKQTYAIRDNNINENMNYYRLKQVDIDGNYYYSPIRLVEFDEIQFTLFPIPVDKELYVSIKNIDSYNIEILDNLGKKIDFNYEKLNLDTISINSEKINKGIYYILLTNGNNSLNKAFIKN